MAHCCEYVKDNIFKLSDCYICWSWWPNKDGSYLITSRCSHDVEFEKAKILIYRGMEKAYKEMNKLIKAEIKKLNP